MKLKYKDLLIKIKNKMDLILINQNYFIKKKNKNKKEYEK